MSPSKRTGDRIYKIFLQIGRASRTRATFLDVASSSSSDGKRKVSAPQSLYDAVTRRSQPDRYLRRRKVDPRSGRTVGGRPVAPEEVLASRWQRQLQRLGEVDGEDDEEVDKNTKMIQSGLALSGEREEALPDSVRVFFGKGSDGQDLLKAVHQYTSDFFNHQGLEDVCARSFDGSSLLAMGMCKPFVR
jgi:hypothetical protein